MSDDQDKNDKESVDNKIIEMSPVVHLDPSTDIHKSFPCEFFQNKNLCDYAVALGGYLHSLPATWTPRRVHIKNHLNWGKKKWDKACEDLRNEGYMLLEIGGKTAGARLRFSIYKNFPTTKTAKVIHKRRSPLATVAFSDGRLKRPSRYIYNHENINILEDHKQGGTRVLESELGVLLKSWGWYPGQIINAIKKHGVDVMYHQVGLVRESNRNKPVANRGGLLTAQLKRLEESEKESLSEI